MPDIKPRWVLKAWRRVYIYALDEQVEPDNINSVNTETAKLAIIWL